MYISHQNINLYLFVISINLLGNKFLIFVFLMITLPFLSLANDKQASSLISKRSLWIYLMVFCNINLGYSIKLPYYWLIMSKLFYIQEWTNWGWFDIHLWKYSIYFMIWTCLYDILPYDIHESLSTFDRIKNILFLEYSNL